MPLVVSDSDEDAGMISYIQRKKKRQTGAHQKPLLVAGALIIVVLLAVIAALCYVLVKRTSLTESTTTTAPSVTEHTQTIADFNANVITAKPTEDTRKQQTPNWKVTFGALGTD